jgi:hypothetical protein
VYLQIFCPVEQKEYHLPPWHFREAAFPTSQISPEVKAEIVAKMRNKFFPPAFVGAIDAKEETQNPIADWGIYKPKEIFK